MQDTTKDQQEWIIRANQIQRQLDDYLTHLLNSKHPRVLPSTNWLPSVDIHETSDSIVLIAEVAGITADNIEATVSGKKLIISGRREPHPTLKQSRTHQLEIGLGHFARIVDLPSPVITSRARAFLHSGMLEIVLPKSAQFIEDSFAISIRSTNRRHR